PPTGAYRRSRRWCPRHDRPSQVPSPNPGRTGGRRPAIGFRHAPLRERRRTGPENGRDEPVASRPTPRPVTCRGGASARPSASTPAMRPSLSILAFLGRRCVGRRNHARRASTFVFPALTLRRQAGAGPILARRLGIFLRFALARGFGVASPLDLALVGFLLALPVLGHENSWSMANRHGRPFGGRRSNRACDGAWQPQ